jgi:hypothetical protein
MELITKYDINHCAVFGATCSVELKVMAPFGRALEMTITNINSFSQQDLLSTASTGAMRISKANE